jgi:hypothetical protein
MSWLHILAAYTGCIYWLHIYGNQANCLRAIDTMPSVLVSCWVWSSLVVILPIEIPILSPTVLGMECLTRMCAGTSHKDSEHNINVDFDFVFVCASRPLQFSTSNFFEIFSLDFFPSKTCDPSIREPFYQRLVRRTLLQKSPSARRIFSQFSRIC